MQKIMKRLRGQRGFTLIEVLVVIVILGILAAILVPNITSWIDRSQQKVDQIEAERGGSTVPSEVDSEFPVSP